ncbi:MAG: hypothetical protein IKT43_00430, partial [Clostridia bacterium]|nr:hypothetical protein [Clostridia bacterium]
KEPKKSRGGKREKKRRQAPRPNGGRGGQSTADDATLFQEKRKNQRKAEAGRGKSGKIKNFSTVRLCGIMQNRTKNL